MTGDRDASTSGGHVQGPASVPLPLGPEAPGRARQEVSRALAGWGIDVELRDDAALVVSELVTNAVLHAGGHLRLDVSGTGDVVRLAVTDGSSAVPQPREAGPLETSGRGLAIVAAIASRWGVDDSAAGKTVWAELDLPDRSASS